MRTKMLVVIAMLLLCSTVYADDIHLLENEDKDWFNPNNWDLGRIPTIDDDVYIDLWGLCKIAGPMPALAKNLHVGIEGCGSLRVESVLIVQGNIYLGQEVGSFGYFKTFTNSYVVCDEVYINDGSFGTIGKGQIAANRVELNQGLIVMIRGVLYTPRIDCYGGAIFFHNGGRIEY